MNLRINAARALILTLTASLATTGYVPSSLALNRIEKAEIIDTAYKNLKMDFKKGTLKQDAAIDTFSNTLIQNEIDLKDVLTYVRVHSTPEQYVSFENQIFGALKKTNIREATGQELNYALQTAFQTVEPQGLAVTGCFGLGAGIVLAVGAIVVGIVALTKTKGEARIRSQYLNRINNLTQEYITEKNRIENRTVEIDREINGYNGTIQSNNSRISYLSGALVAAKDPAQIKGYAAEIQQLTKSNNEITAKISALTVERAQYANEEYRNAKLEQLKVNYDNTYSQLEVERENRVKMVPTEKALAGKLGIAAGVAAALGTVLIVDGARDCD